MSPSQWLSEVVFYGGNNLVLAGKNTFLTLALASLLMTGCAVKPKSMDKLEAFTFAQDRLDRVAQNEEPVTGAIDLYEAMARAIKYNLDVRVEAMEAALRTSEVNVASYDLLPKLVAESGYSARNNTDTSSVGSRDPSSYSADLNLSWNVLDFGLSYVRAKQTADKVLQQEENRRKIVNLTIADVRTAYWRAVTYDRVVARMHALSGRLKSALFDTRKLAKDGATSPMAALTYERELLQIQRELEGMEAELSVAKTQLAALMNVTPGTDFKLAATDAVPANLKLPGDFHQLYITALQNRPEMREMAYELRVNDQELNAQLLSLLPGLSIYSSSNYDSNDFLSNNNWLTWGAKASWNLLRAFSMPATKAKVEAQGTMLDTRSLSVAMAVMTQVHVSRAKFLQTQKQFKTASELADVQRKLLNVVKAEVGAQRTSQQVLIREEMNTIVSDSKRDVVFADLQNAYASVYSSLGLDAVPSNMKLDVSVSDLAQQLRTVWKSGETLPGLQLQPTTAAAAQAIDLTTSSLPASTQAVAIEPDSPPTSSLPKPAEPPKTENKPKPVKKSILGALRSEIRSKSRLFKLVLNVFVFSLLV